MSTGSAWRVIVDAKVVSVDKNKKSRACFSTIKPCCANTYEATSRTNFIGGATIIMGGGLHQDIVDLSASLDADAANGRPLRGCHPRDGLASLFFTKQLAWSVFSGFFASFLQGPNARGAEKAASFAIVFNFSEAFGVLLRLPLFVALLQITQETEPASQSSEPKHQAQEPFQAKLLARHG
ncbi:MAG TPA: hypothetical protein VJ783_28680 [Pirellulales bacterium]|nr:hypothetical protein [Pirellulales bacterium]